MSLQELNLTKLDLSWRDPYGLVQDYPGLKIILLVLMIGTLVFGTLCHGVIILFERYGQDFHKRGLINQLVSQIAILTLIHYWCVILLLMWRIFVSPVTDFFWWFWYSLSTCYAFACGLTLAEYLLIKYMSTVILKRMLPILDDFFATFLATGNLAFGLVFGFANCYTEEGFLAEMRSAGLPPTMASYRKYQPKFLGTFLVLLFLLYFSLHIHMKWKLEQGNKQSDPDPNPSDNDNGENIEIGNVMEDHVNSISLGMMNSINLNSGNNVNVDNNNTTVYNNEAVATKSVIFCGIVGAISGISSGLGNFVELVPGENMKLFVFFMGDFTHMFTLMVLVPTAFAMGNFELKKYATRLIGQEII